MNTQEFKTREEARQYILAYGEDHSTNICYTIEEIKNVPYKAFKIIVEKIN